MKMRKIVTNMTPPQFITQQVILATVIAFFWEMGVASFSIQGSPLSALAFRHVGENK